MCEPFSASTMFYLATAASTAVGIMSAQQSARAQAASANYNAQVAQQQAGVVREQRGAIIEDADNERRRLADRYGQVSGDVEASFAAQGLDPNVGTGYQLRTASRQAYDIDKSIISRNADANLRANDLEAHGLLTQAELMRREGRYARKAGNLESWGALLSGGSKIADKWQQSNPGGG